MYTSTTIRIKFNNNIILEGLFSPKETVKIVIEFVREVNLNTPKKI